MELIDLAILAGPQQSRNAQCVFAACLTLGMACAAGAAPVVQVASGTVTHKGTITIVGSGFGTKSPAAPIVWDDASGTDILAKWDGAWPDTSGPSGATYQTKYRAIQRGIGLPHTNITKYIAGAHGDSAGPAAGYNVMFWKNRTISLPAVTYMSYYFRADDAWVFGLGSPPDNNYKNFDYSTGTSPYDPTNWYTAYNAGPNNRTETTQWIVNDDSSSLVFPDQNGKNRYWGSPAVNPMAGAWAKIEVAMKHTSANDGYIKVWENGVLMMDYLGKTDSYPGTIRNVGFGGYARAQGNPNQWRYFADAYLDYTLARVVLANSPTLSNATIIENQIPTSWSDTAITISVNLGKFTLGQTGYIFVVDPSGVASAAGFTVPIGGAALASPANLRVN